MSYRFPPEHYRAKAIIKACVEVGAGIEHIEDAPHFRYIPPTQRADDHSTDLHGGGPSNRGSIACGRRNVLKLKVWSPSRLDANPMYQVPMAGDDPELTKARNHYHMGAPGLLRDWLAKYTAAQMAAKRRNVTHNQFKAIRVRAGLTQSQLAERLRIGDLRTIRRYESGEREISGPVSILMEQLGRE